MSRNRRRRNWLVFYLLVHSVVWGFVATTILGLNDGKKLRQNSKWTVAACLLLAFLPYPRLIRRKDFNSIRPFPAALRPPSAPEGRTNS
jgi:hypothetical protein